ncbi:MAG TPA: hypothetical protein VLM89_09020 [Phycisphaerae bacterium]|nr:hypothetical protein [Phycisphaerae bacterium]
MKTATRHRQTPEQRKIDRELQDRIRQMGPEARGMMLVIAREAVQPGTMHQMLFGARAI